jgi:general L-amino acid transport system permease protein
MIQTPAAVKRPQPTLRRPWIGLSDIWHNLTFRAWFYQVAVIGVILLSAAYLIGNAQDALRSLGISTGFGFLVEPAGFDIGETPIAFQSTDSFARAYAVALLNTLKVAAISIVLATLIGVTIGIARLSSNILIRGFASFYVELFRNTPQLVQLIFWYAVMTQLPPVRQAISVLDIAFLSNRGLVVPWPLDAGIFAGVIGAFLASGILAALFIRWTDKQRRMTGRKQHAVLPTAVIILVAAPLVIWAVTGASTAISVPTLQGFNFRGGTTLSPEFIALLLGLSLYIAAFIAEIVRSGIQSVGRGQIEAARAIGLGQSDIYRKVILPQAMRVMVPPTAAQFVSLVKNSSLGVAIGYPELFNINNTIITLSGHTVEAIGIMMAIYLSISFSIAALMNLYNRHVQIRER